MIYDSDIGRVRNVAWFILIFNLCGAVFCAWTHEWVGAAAGLLWCCNVVVWLRVIKEQQHTRDEARISNAAILKVLAGDRLE